ncbi:hypothetical protein T484DRAFT_1955272 [Baffinella frigidus]|jgi:hypothetical protein|nr:hypothetical protein T484DRAFT_1955272 [Cryptophyta sp. CCMP2293]
MPPPSLSHSMGLPAVEQTPSPMALKAALVMRGASMHDPMPGKAKASSSQSEGFDDFGEECEDVVSATSSEEVHDSFGVSVATSEAGDFAPISQNDRLKSLQAPAWWAEALSPNDMRSKYSRPLGSVDDEMLYAAWWGRVRPARKENTDPKVHSTFECGLEDRPADPRPQLEGGHDVQLWSKDSSSQVDGGDDGSLRERWWCAVRHRTDHHSAAEKRSSPVDSSPSSSSDALRHHDYTLARAGGTRRAMRQKCSARVKLESPIAPLPAPARASPVAEESSSVGMLAFDAWWSPAPEYPQYVTL